MSLSSFVADRVSPAVFQKDMTREERDEFVAARDRNKLIAKRVNRITVIAASGAALIAFAFGVKSCTETEGAAKDKKIADVTDDVHALYPSASNVQVVFERDASNVGDGVETPAVPGSVAFEQPGQNGQELCTSLTATYANEVGIRLVGPLVCRPLGE